MIYLLIGYRDNDSFEKAKPRLLQDLGEDARMAIFARSEEELYNVVKEEFYTIDDEEDKEGVD